MNKIKTATPEQWQEIEACRLRWLNEEQTAQYPIDEIRDEVLATFDRMELEHPAFVWVVDSPHAARLISGMFAACSKANLGDNLRDNLRDNLWDNLWASLGDNLWANLGDNLRDNLGASLRMWCGKHLNAWAGWVEAGDVLGVPRHKDFEPFLNWNRKCSVWMWDSQFIYVLKNPTEIHWGDNGLHNSGGPAVRYSPVYALWFIEGVMVDEQIVMLPETQTLEQIKNEDNEEVKRIRIERYGWDRYLGEAGASVIDQAENDIEQTKEAVMQCDDMRVFVGACPSTARVYALEVPTEIDTCEQARRWLANDDKFTCIGAT